MRKERISALDGIRVLSIFVVMLYHINESFFVSDLMFRYGDVGVMCCFCISGFLVSYLHGDTYENCSWRDSLSVFRSKLVKFYPCHLVTFLLIFPLTIYENVHSVGSLVKYIGCGVINLLLLHCWVPYRKVSYSFNGVSWYLSALLFLYLASPWIVRWMKRIQKKYGLLCCGLLCFVWEIVVRPVPIILRMLYPQVSEELIHWMEAVSPLVHCSVFILGIWGGLWFQTYQERGKKTTSVLGVVIVSCTFFWLVQKINFPLAAVVSLSVLLRKKWVACLLGNRLTAFISSFSFELYMLHQIVIRYVSYIFPYEKMSPIMGYVICIVLSFVLSYLLHIWCVRISRKTVSMQQKH